MRFTFFLYYIDVIQCAHHTHSTSWCGLATRQVLDSDMWPVATRLYRFVATFPRKSQVFGHVLPSGALCWWLAVLPAQEKALVCRLFNYPSDHRSAERIRLGGQGEGTLLTRPSQGQERSVDRNARLSHGHIEPEITDVDLCTREY